ncbi:RAB GDP-DISSOCIATION INHIBITOR [Salix koriyanagi]|uniref:RAB GDP-DISSOCIATION INHIBITOR n=1 Tax=Salix koriyanagi TaxID=2511006 RepID=A0A9Q0P661_9ROSI|nr:RAB GDP-DISSOCIATION INHIBITOR [Salix koriyanagi]
MEFNSVDASFVGDGNGKLWNVPDSRADMFKNKSLTLMEKNQLMRFTYASRALMYPVYGPGDLPQALLSKVTRGICTTRGFLRPDRSNLLAVYPLQSLSSEKVTSIRALQISGNLAVYCLGRFCQRQLLPCLLEKLLISLKRKPVSTEYQRFVLYPFSFVTTMPIKERVC